MKTIIVSEMALMKKLAYCVGSKTHSIDIVEKMIPDKIEYKIIVKVSVEHSTIRPQITLLDR